MKIIENFQKHWEEEQKSLKELVKELKTKADKAEEQAKAVQAGAQFWIIKSDDIEPRLEEFRNDYEGYKNRTAPFKVYK